MLGISISSFAYPLIVLDETGSPARAGLVGSVLAGTGFFLRLPAGVLVDRWNRRAIMIACDLGRALNAGAFAIALALGHFFYAQVLAVAFVEAALGVLFGPAEAAAVRRVVAPEQVRDAVAQNQSRTAIPGLFGPPLGGVLLTVGRALPFVADAVSYLVSLVCVASVRAPLGGGGPTKSVRKPLADVFTGLRWIWAQRFLRTLLLWFVGVGVVFSSIGLVVLVLARDRGASAGELGLAFAITAAGGVIGALITPAVLRRFRPARIVVTFAWVSTATTFLLLAADSPYVIGALGGIAFLFAPPVNAIAFAAIAEGAPDELQGRVTSAGIQISSLGAPVGPLVAGVLLGALGAARAIVVYGCALFVLAVIASVSKGLRSP
jgi:predicted MFS family arabinose efflux permease